MWNRIKRWFGADANSRAALPGGTRSDFKWYVPGDDNPFGILFLDVRPLTWKVVAATKDPRIAETFGIQRQSNGREFISAAIDNSKTVVCELAFPHNGDAVEGIVFKADSMDVKWDIYIYNSVFLFVRSWTGKLEYRAFAEIGDRCIRIYKIETSSEHVETAPQAVYFLLGTHVMRRVLPHTIPRDTPDDPQLIAFWSFGRFGKLACYATFEDNTRIEIPRPDD